MCEIDELIHEDPIPDPIPESEPIQSPEPELISGPELIQSPEPEVIPGPDPIPGSELIQSPEPESDIYNEQKNEDSDELGSCDCRSECRYNTGESGKYRDYGFWP